MKSTDEMSKWITWPLRLVFYALILVIAYYMTMGILRMEYAAHAQLCFDSIKQRSDGLNFAKSMVSCIKQKSNALENFTSRPLFQLINAMPNIKSELVGEWMASQPDCNYKHTLDKNGRFVSEPMGCAISNRTYRGTWGVYKDHMVWLVDSQQLWPPDINIIDVVDPDFFLLTEQNGSQTRFTRLNTEKASHSSDSESASRIVTDPPSARADDPSFIDVWQLRREVAELEPLEASDDTDECYPEGDGEDEDPITPEQQAMLDRESSACERRITEAYARYQSSWKLFNARWLPLMREAIRKGDHVAEVIMRQCDTTPVLDRSWIESTCDTDESRRAFAIKRLKEINFVPAIPFEPEIRPEWKPLRGASNIEKLVNAEMRKEALRRIPKGALGGFNLSLIYMGGNLADTAQDIEQYRDCDAIFSAIRDASRAFTVAASDSATPERMALSKLQLNRKPTSVPISTSDSCIQGGELFVRSNSGISPAVINPVNGAELLSAMESNIDRYLKQDPRWAVFLLNRVGREEWAPTVMVDERADSRVIKQPPASATQNLSSVPNDSADSSSRGQ